MEEKGIKSPRGAKKRNWGLLGAVIAALAAASCCVIPLVLVFAGVGGAWAGNLSVLAPYRPFFILLTLAFLGAAFYRVYKPNHEACEVDGPCADGKLRKRNKIILWAVTATVLGLNLFPYATPYLFAQSAVKQQVKTGQATLTVKNMTCDACVATVKKSLTRLDGVVDAIVTLNPPRAVVVYDPGKVKVEELVRATTDAGYPSAAEEKNDE